MKKIFAFILIVFAIKANAQAPTQPAPTPTCPGSDVISLFSNAYNDVPVNTWLSNSSYGPTTLTDLQIAGDDVKLYENLGSAGILALNPNSIDASNMTHLNIDIWTPNMTDFSIKVVDYGPNGGLYGIPNDDVEDELTFSISALNEWITLSIPITDFAGLATIANIAQLTLVGDPLGSGTLYIDNVYFSGDCVIVPTGPQVAAPIPSCPAASVISLFSNAYSDVSVDTWITPWSFPQTTQVDLQIAGDDAKLYENLGYVGVETFGGGTIDASGMQHFNMDIWTSNIDNFKIKLVDLGADASFGGGDDVEHEVTIVSPAQNQWVSLVIPLSDFIGLTTTAHIAQYIFSCDPYGTGTVYVDNVYFSGNCAGGTGPQVAAPTPSCPSGDVISLFSNAFADVAVDTWRTSWSHGPTALTDLQVAGDDVKLYENLGFVGVETVNSGTIDASGMTHFNMDFWTPDMTDIKIKLVDFGANGAFDGGGDDTEHELTVSVAGLNQWVTLSIPLTDFTGLTTTSNIAQYIFSSVPFGTGTVYIDNVYFSGNCAAGGTGPQVAAPMPSCPSGDVISLFSNAFADVSVDTWRTSWSHGPTSLTDLQVAGDDVKLYENLGFVGVETVNSGTIDASAMTHFNMDFWTPDMTDIKIKLVDFGANGVFDGGGDDTEHELTVSVAGLNQWVTLSIPLTDFTGLTTTSNMAQYIFSSVPFGAGTVYIDNVYFSGDCASGGTGPQVAAPTPSCPSGDVISLFSNAFADVAVDTWRTSWSHGPTALTDLQVAGDDVKLYENLGFVGVETVNSGTIDASAMTHFNMDFWTPDMTDIKIKLVDFGANGVFDGGGDDTEHELTISVAGLNQWVTLSIPLTVFTGLTTTSNMAQYIFSSVPFGAGTVYIDNVYFSGDCASGGTGPQVAAPTPSCPSGDVISLFSNAFADVAVDTWRTSWSHGPTALTDLQVAGDDVKLYENLGFVGVETVNSGTIDASGMTHFNMDFWTPDMTDIKIKLVDFGANGAFDGGGDDTEHELTVSVAGLNQWVTLSIPLTDFTGLTTTSNMAQYIFSSVPFGAGTVYIDNVYFSGDCAAGGTGPQVAAPTPSCPSGDVISLFSDIYTDVSVDTWRTDWTFAQTTLTDLQIAGDDVKLYENLGFVGVETVANTIDASSMTHFHMDIWTADIDNFRIKLVDFGANGVYDGGGDDSEHELTIASPAQNQWISLSIPISSFVGLNATNNIAQYIFSCDPYGMGNVYIDNVFFSNNCATSQPLTAAPTPANCDATSVISLFSNAYTDVPVDTWRTSWSVSDFADVQINGDDTKLYTNLNYAGVEFIANQIDASALTHFQLDFWTSNMTEFRIKLVDFGPNGIFQGSPNDDTEHEIIISNPNLNQWVSLDIPLTDFTGLTTTSNLSQLIFSGNPAGNGTIYIDNVLLRGDCNPIPPCPVLVWEDEFLGSTLDLTKWTPQIGDGCPNLCGWGNSELQYYRAENAVVSNGTLKIIAKEESFGGKNYTSARLRTKDKADFTYGRFEASIKMPIGQGIWPAFWMLSTDEPYGGWPQSGEIDIVELLGQEPDLIHGTIHYGPAWPNNQSSTATYRLANGTFNDDFHEYAIEWDETEIRWYVDDILYSTKTTADTAPHNWPYDHDFHMLLNMAVGGNWPGSPDASTMFPQTMEIDYVRVYKGEFASISGNQQVDFMAQGEVYSVANPGVGATFSWTVPAGAMIVSGQGTASIVVDWGDNTSSGPVNVVVNGCASQALELDVEVLPEIVDVLDCVLENFDDAALITYEFSTGTLVEDLNNPAPDATNSSALVGQYTRMSSEQYDVMIYNIDSPFSVGNFVTGDNKFYIDIYTSAPIGSTVILQLEDSNVSLPANYPTGRHSRYQIVTTTQNQWETLEFQHLDRPDGSVPDVNVDKIIFLFEPNSFTGDMFYFDNFEKHCFASPATMTSDSPKCAGTSITLDVQPAGMVSYTFFADANLNGVMDSGELVQSGSANQYASSSFADGVVIGAMVENSAGCTQTIMTTISLTPPDYTFAGYGGLTGQEIGVADYETNGAIESTQTIGASAIVDYDSALEINLLPNFETLRGAQFEAFIDGCNNGAGGQN